jgi:hypothetical protein
VKKSSLLESETKAFSKNILPSIPDAGVRRRIKEALEKITFVAQKAVLGLQGELDSTRRELEQEREKRAQAEEILRKREPLLTERVKEISCLYSIVSLMLDRTYPSEEDKIKDIVKIIPTGWHCPQDACARIVLWGREFRTDNYQGTPWKQVSSIIVNGEPAGSLSVGYLKEKPVREEGPFLLEERTLLDVLARLIGEILGPKLHPASLNDAHVNARQTR